MRCGIVLDTILTNAASIMRSEKPLHIFTWHIHGSYLYYLSQGNYIIYIPVSEDKTDRNIGRGETFPFGDNVIEVPVNEIPKLHIDCVLYQHKENYTLDQYKILTEEQRRLPRIYLEHDPPWEHPTNTKHVVNDPDVLVVHVTHFNRLMWDNHGIRTTVIEHGVSDKQVPYNGSLEKGIVVINNLPSRGRLLGLDIFEEVRKHIPLDLVGMGTEELGLGEVLHPQLPGFISQYRFFFNPIRYTSFGLAVCEAMMGGLPVVGMATTEMPTVFTNKTNGIIHTDIHYLISEMQKLIDDRDYAARIGAAGRQTALERFNVRRFTDDWESVFRTVTKTRIYEKTDSIYQ
jgi:glycosyltransferase involved in cell wall biosynthesis